MPSLADKRAKAEYSCSTCEGPNFSQGLQTYRVPMALYELNRARLTQAMLEKHGWNDKGSDGDGDAPTGLILLEGGKTTTRYDTDFEPVFRQESYFHWAFGVSEPDCYAAISLPSGEATIFVPQNSQTYQIFCGRDSLSKDVKAKYGVEHVRPLEEMAGFVSSQLERGEDGKDKGRLHLLRGLNTDSGNMATPAHYDGISKHSSVCTTEYLFECMAKCRVIKTSAEAEVMRYTNWVSSMAHVDVMRGTKPGMMEYQLESLFQHHTYTHGGCRHMSYTCICACGPNPAILHYGHAGRPNDRLLGEDDMALLDMGAEYHCYASDVTCSFPVNGVFSDDQRIVYEAVLDAQIEVLRLMKPGASWSEMHRVAERAVLKGLIEGGVLRGELDEMIDANLGAIFMPHGLGHLIGLDAHDVGGYLEGTPPRSERPGLNKLRTARVLESGLVLTVEPGCYFIDLLLDEALLDPTQSKFINAERLADFRGSGGVRLEDDILVTEDGCDNLTMCPRAVSEIVDVMTGGKSWPPEKDLLPELRRSWVKRENGRMVRLKLSDGKIE